VSAGEVRAFLEHHGLAANRDLGQNFLVESAVAERLVELAGVEAGEGVLEIGTGLGILTRALAKRGARVVTLEVDAGLVRALEADAVLPDSVTLVHGDALEADLGALAARAGTQVRLVANLPYSISGPLLRRLLDMRETLVDWSVMLQRDVAQRLLAEPGTRDYGSLAVLHRLLVDVSRGMDLSPRCFFPVPKVRSTFIRVQPRSDTSMTGGELAALETFVRAAFSKRRKTLANALRDRLGADAGQAIAACGVDPGLRAQQLAPETFLALSRALADRLEA
jgi:16S rRNA (adenine1518-N6/adenine1519-N6)-dimethyltransferase